MEGYLLFVTCYSHVPVVHPLLYITPLTMGATTKNNLILMKFYSIAHLGVRAHWWVALHRVVSKETQKPMN